VLKGYILGISGVIYVIYEEIYAMNMYSYRYKRYQSDLVVVTMGNTEVQNTDEINVTSNICILFIDENPRLV